MADGFHPLHLGTIMMFGSLEFMSLGSGYDMVLLPPRDDTETRPEPIPPKPVCGRRSGHHAGGARRGRQRSRISDATTEAMARPALPPHIHHQIAHSSSPPGARGRAHRAMSSVPWTNRGASRPPVLPRSKGKARLPPPTQKRDQGALTSRHPPPTDGGKTAAPPKLPFGFRSTAATYASSASTSLSAYADLLGHHLRSTLDLISTPPISSYPEDPTSGEDEWADADFSGCGDPETFMRFLVASNYCLGYSDSDNGGYDPSRECFNLEVEGAPPNAQGGVGPSERRNATAPPNTTPGIHRRAHGAASAPIEGRRPNLEQLNELEARLEEEHVRLRQPRETLVQDQSARWDGGEARRHAWDVNCHIIKDEGGDNPPAFSTASQNVMAAALLLRAMLEPSTPEGRRVRHGLRGLLEQAVVQNTESSASQSHGTRRPRDQPPPNKAPTVQGLPPPNLQGGNKAPSVHERVGTNVDARATLEARWRDRDEAESRRYRPRRGGRYDPDHDRSTSPEPPGPRVFSEAICRAKFPARFQQPANLTKYSGETNPELWLADYRIACQLSRADDDMLIIRNLPLHLDDSARAWLKHLPERMIHGWADLVRIFVENFKGTYVHPGNSWDIRSCRQKPDESLRDFIR